MKLSVAEFRAKLREAFNAAENGEYVFITRHEKWFKLIAFDPKKKADIPDYKQEYPPKKNTPVATQQKDYSTCKHGAVKGFCKKGCK